MDSLTHTRNISIIAHIDAGKTTTTERMLFYSGMTHRIGEVDDGTTVMDYLEEERARGITIVAAAASFHWRDGLVHLIDTPGHIDFTAEVERSLRVIDGAVVIFSGVEGVEAQSEKVWHQADRYHVPRLAFINKLDRQGAEFARVIAEIRAKFGRPAIALQLPLGREQEFRSVVDLLTLELITFGGADGEDVQRVPVPDEHRAAATAARTAMIEALADHSDAIAERYLEGQEIGPDLLRAEIRRLTIATRIVPAFAGASRRNLGVQPVMDAVLDYLPSPLEVPEIAALDAKTEAPVSLKLDAKAPFAGLVFKVVASPSADLYYLRTYTGTLKVGDSVYVPRTKETIRIKRLLRLYAKASEPIDEVGPGDIVGLVGPKDIVTGDSLCAFHRRVLFESMAFPEPVISVAVEPKSSRDKDRLDEALGLLCREDPTLSVSTDENTGQRLLAGMGELHLEIKIKRVGDEFNVPVRSGEPRVAFRETVQREIGVSETFSKTLGETELFAGVELTLRPLDAQAKPFQITSSVRDPAVPKALLEAALQALGDSLKTGGNHGYPLIYVAGELTALQIDPVRTTEGAVLGAVLQATNRAIAEGGTVLLEPVMRLEVLTPEPNLGDVSNELTKRRGLIHEVNDVASLKRVHCEVPLAEMFGFSKALPKLTGGRGSFSMEPHGYKPREVPA